QKPLPSYRQLLQRDGNIREGPILLLHQIETMVIRQHPEQNGMSACCMCSLVKVEGGLDGCAMAVEVGGGILHWSRRGALDVKVQRQFQVVSLPLHGGSGHTWGDGYTPVPIDIAIDAGEIKQERCEAQRQ